MSLDVIVRPKHKNCFYCSNATSAEEQIQNSRIKIYIQVADQIKFKILKVYTSRLPLVGEEPHTATMKFAFDGSNDDPSYRMDARTVACQSPRGSVFYLYFLQVLFPHIWVFVHFILKLLMQLFSASDWMLPGLLCHSKHPNNSWIKRKSSSFKSGSGGLAVKGGIFLCCSHWQKRNLSVQL